MLYLRLLALSALGDSDLGEVEGVFCVGVEVPEVGRESSE